MHLCRRPRAAWCTEMAWLNAQMVYLEKLRAARQAVSDLALAAKAAGDELGETTARVIQLRITLTIERNTLYADKGQGDGR